MNNSVKEKIIQVCDSKITKSGENVGLSFYAFFKNKNSNPKELMGRFNHQFDHFEKAMKIKGLVMKG